MIFGEKRKGTKGVDLWIIMESTLCIIVNLKEMHVDSILLDGCITTAPSRWSWLLKSGLLYSTAMVLMCRRELSFTSGVLVYV